jgi:uncharacterized SAM-binding protein YcdF (DUF218 family)
MSKNKFGFLLFLIAMGFFIIPSSFNMTGNIIGGGLELNFYFIIGFVFLVGCFIVFALRQSLDAIVIPTGGKYHNKQRTDAAAQEYLKRGAKKLIISGTLEGKPVSESQTAEIYKQLREYGIKPKDMGIESKSKNTLENLLNVLEKLKEKGAKSIGIASNPSHLDRYGYILEQAKKQGIVDKSFKIYRIETDESFRDKIYGFFSNLFYRYKLRSGLDKAKKRETPQWMKKIAKMIWRE